MELSYYCELIPINWSAVSELPSLLRRFGYETVSVSAMLRRFPEAMEMEALDQIPDYVRRKGEPRAFEINLRGTQDKGAFTFSLTRGTDIEGERYLSIRLNSKSPEEHLRAAMSLLGLSPEQPATTKHELPRTVFIAHRFDAVGQEVADKVALFLTILGFDCVTGRGYAPGSVSEKVKSRIQGQAVVVVVWTPGEDSTWLVQESLLSNLVGKPLILIKEVNSTFKPGLLADHEFIPFTSPRIEQAFIPLLEGLRSVGFRFSKNEAAK